MLVVIGELFFRADSLRIGMSMFWKILTSFRPASLRDGTLLSLGLDRMDYLAVGGGILIVFLVSCAEEKGVDVRSAIARCSLPVRWAIYYSVLLAVCLFGAYGVGYSPVDLIYANF